MAAPAQARWAVLGASGQIGHFLMRRLAQSGEPALAISRRVPAAGIASGPIRWLEGDLDAAMPPFEAERLISAGPLDACARWLARAAAPAPCRSLVAFSSSSLESKAHSTDPEERAVADRLAHAEAALSRACADRGIALTLLRPTLIYGCGLDRNLTSLARTARRFGALPLPRSSEGRRQPVHADDLAALALESALAPGTRTYALAGGETLPFRDMAARVLACLPGRPRLWILPDAVFRAVNAGARMLRRDTGLSRAQVDRLARDLVFDDAPARDELGWAPRPFRPEAAMFEPPRS